MPLRLGMISHHVRGDIVNTSLAISGILCFVVAYFVGYWPKFCLDKFRKIFTQSKQGVDGYQISFREMKKMDGHLFKQYLLGLFLSITLSVLAIILLISAPFC